MAGYENYRSSVENAYKREEFLYYGSNVRLGAGVSIGAPERLHIGDDTAIDARCHIQAVGGCHIGRGCQIGAETIILTIEHQYTGGESLPYDSIRLIKPVYIEDFVWIGVRTSIAPGVRIGEGAIIGMGSVLVQDVPPLAIVAGNPAQVLTYRSKPDFERLKSQNAIVDPYRELPLLKVPPLTRRKYRKELAEFGFDLPAGKEFFHYDKSAPRGKALRVVDASNGSVATHRTTEAKNEVS
jgi:maltose O-acetyltransferase